MIFCIPKAEEGLGAVETGRELLKLLSRRQANEIPTTESLATTDGVSALV